MLYPKSYSMLETPQIQYYSNEASCRDTMAKGTLRHTAWRRIKLSCNGLAPPKLEAPKKALLQPRALQTGGYLRFYVSVGKVRIQLSLSWVLKGVQDVESIGFALHAGLGSYARLREASMCSVYTSLGG